jgi:lipoprotein-anchoring transpeptidase ErfK/SrfK
VTFGPVPARGGKHGSATPTGMFSVLYKDKHHYSKQFDAPMPYSVFFYPGDALHADNPRTASNGCIHLTAQAARQFYQGLNQGDPVQVIG